MKQGLKYVLAVAMIAMGIAHFAEPAPFVRSVPDWLPAPLWLVYLSGMAELLGGLGLVVSKTQRVAAYGLMALYLVVFPANVHMALRHIEPVPGHPWPEAALWGRLPLQLLFIAWAFWYTRPEPSRG